MDQLSDFAPGEAVIVPALPVCDLCIHIDGKTIGAASVAEYDGKTVNGPWANMCTAHFTRYGLGLGTGRGQRLLLKGSSND